MKELTSKKYPNRMPQVIDEETYERMVATGAIKKYRVKDIAPIKMMIPTPKLMNPKVVEVKRPKSK